MNKQRKTSHILNVFQYDVDGHVVLPASLTLTVPPAGNDNSAKVTTTAWVRTYVSGLSYITGNQSITVSGDATGSGTTSIALTLANTAVTPGTYGSTTLVPVVTVDSKGRITSVTTAAISGSLTFTGDVTGSGTTGTSTALTLAASGVTAGTYTKVTVDSKGRVTVGASATTSDISEGTNLYYTDARVLSYLSANTYATQSYVNTQVSNLVASAPATLDTLNELAAALGNDPSFATTISTALGNRLRVDINTQGLSATLQGYGRTNLGLGTAAVSATGDFATAAQGTKADTAFGWDNHASAGYLTSALAATTYVSLTGAYANPAFVASLAYSKITGVPAFLTSYTETDPYRVTTVAVSGTSTKTITLTRADASTVTTTWTDYDTDTNTYVTSAGFSGGTLTLTRNDAGTVTVSLDGRYYLATNPSGYISSYTETDTLATVTARGASTSTASIFSNSLAVGHSSHYDSAQFSLDVNGGLLIKNTGKTAHLILINANPAAGGNAGFVQHLVGGTTTGAFASIQTYYGASVAAGTLQLQPNGGSVTIGGYTVYHTGNTPTYNQNTTGTAASISGFNNPTTAATANTIAYRDGSGDLYARYFLGGYINTSDNVDTGTITYIMAKFGDNYHRSATAAKVQAFLGLGSAAYQNTGAFLSSSGSVTVGGYLTVTGSGTSSSIYMSDTDEGQREIHCNSNRIGFLTQAGNWGAYCDDSGNWFANNLSGTNTGDQTNISGNAGTVSDGVYLSGTQNITGTKYFVSNRNTSSDSPPLQAYSNNGSGAIMSFHRGGYYAVNMGLDSDNVFRIGGWSAGANRLQLDMSGNLTVAGTLAGTNLSGTNTGDQTNISGNAATATTATTAARATRANGQFYIDDNYGNSIIGVYTSTRYQGVFSMGAAYVLPTDGTTTGNLYGLAWSHPNAGGVASNLNTHGLLVMENGTFLAAVSGSIRARDDVRAPAMYVSGNAVIHAGNIASQSVSYAGSAGSVTGFSGTHSGTSSGTNRGDQIHGTSGITPATSFGSMPSAMSGFTDNWGAGDLPSGMSHVHGIACRHFNNASNNWGWHMVGQYDLPGDLRVRWVNAGTWTGYYQLVTTSNIGSQKADGSLKLWAASHPNDYYIVNNWTGTHWQLTSNHGSGVRVAYADSAGTATDSSKLPLSGGTMSGPIRRDSHSTGFLEGSYNNVGGNSGNTNPIYTIGSAYNPSDTALNSMYGIGYSHPNFWGGKTSSWGMYVCAGGTINATIGSGAVTIWAENDIVAFSDARVKDNIEVVTNAVEKIQAIRGVTFTRKDAKVEDKDKRHAGVIAQEVLKVMPEIVSGTEKDMYSVAYGNMAALFIEAIKEQQLQIEELKNKLDNVLSSR